MNLTETKVLLVDDNSSTAANITERLKQNGIYCKRASAPEQAIECIRTEEFGLILLDAELSSCSKSGTEAAVDITAYKGIPVVFTAENPAPETIKEIQKTRRYGYVSKNTDSVTLIEVLRVACELKEARKEKDKNLKQYKALFYNTHSSMLLIRPETGQILDANPAACNFYGWDHTALTLKKIQQINQLSDEEVAREMQRAESENRDYFYFKHGLADGTIRDVLVHSSPVTIAGERLLYSIINDITEENKKNRENRERVKELECLYTLSEIVEKPGITVRGILKEMVQVIPYSFQYPEVCSAKLKIDEYEYTSPGFTADCFWSLKGYIYIENEKRGLIEISYNKQLPHEYEGPFLKQERRLLDAVAERLGRIIERKHLVYNFKTLFENMKEAFIRTDTEGIITMANPAAAGLCGFDSVKDLLGTHMSALYKNPKKRFAVLDIIKKEKTVWNFEFDLKRKNGSVIYTLCTLRFLENDSGEFTGTEGIFRDISDRKQYEEALQENLNRKNWINTLASYYLQNNESEALIKKTVEQLGEYFTEVRVAYSEIDADGVLTTKYAKQPEGMPDITGLKADLSPAPDYLYSLRNNKITIVEDVENDTMVAPLKDAMKEGNTGAILDIGIMYDGTLKGLLCLDSPVPRVWQEKEIASLEEHANLFALILKNEDHQRNLEKTLEERETLLMEIHHRVKNNLNVVVSLLKLQENNIHSMEDAKKALEESSRRIYSMALVHEYLYKAENLSQVDMDLYIREMIDQVRYASVTTEQVEYQLQLENIKMDISKAIPSGIIINELITNAQKHAFSELEKGIITVILKRDDTNWITLAVKDNGTGMPDDISIDKTKSLGLNLIKLLTHQIDGTLNYDNQEGTSFFIHIPN